MPYRGQARPLFDARMMIHVQLVVIVLWLGFVLMLPADTFNTSPSWRYFARMGSEEAWAVTMFVAAGIGAAGIDTTRRWVKLVSVLFLATVHGSMAMLFLRGNPSGGASGVFATVALSGYYLAWRQTLDIH